MQHTHEQGTEKALSWGPHNKKEKTIQGEMATSWGSSREWGGEGEDVQFPYSMVVSRKGVESARSILTHPGMATRTGLQNLFTLRA